MPIDNANHIDGVADKDHQQPIPLCCRVTQGTLGGARALEPTPGSCRASQSPPGGGDNSEEFYDRYNEWAAMTLPTLVGNVLCLTANKPDGDVAHWQLVSNDKNMYPHVRRVKLRPLRDDTYTDLPNELDLVLKFTDWGDIYIKEVSSTNGRFLK